MIEIEFEWHEEKNLSNYNKHGIDFNFAIAVFDDLCRFEEIDTRKNYGEIRYITLGEIESIPYVVVYTKRNVRYRIISARKAKHEERQDYYRYAKNR